MRIFEDGGVEVGYSVCSFGAKDGYQGFSIIGRNLRSVSQHQHPRAFCEDQIIRQPRYTRSF